MFVQYEIYSSTSSKINVLHAGQIVHILFRNPLDGMGSVVQVLGVLWPRHEDDQEELHRRGGGHCLDDPGKGLPRARNSGRPV